MIDPFIGEEFLNLFAGRQLGSGMSRKVFALPHMPGYVVKIEEDAHRFQNVLEHEFWQHVDHTEMAKWFAPVVGISPNGRVLIMKQTHPVDSKGYPEKLPLFLSDTKRQNYGMLDGRFVCHDYGTCLLPTYGLTKKSRKVDWYDAD